MTNVYFNGNVITMEGKKCSSFAVEGEKFAMSGSDEDVISRYPDAIKTDLKGRTVLPAFFETHMHILSLGMLLKDIKLFFTKA